MKHFFDNKSKFAILALALVSASYIVIGCKGGLIPNSSRAAPALPERNDQGDYDPYYSTGEMNQPRYLHQVVRLNNGLVLVSGGTDERGFSSLDSGEIFDEANIAKDALIPESEAGVWLDTDFEGEPILLEFRRLWHTMSILPDSRVIVVGGAPNFLTAAPIGKVEIFDPDTRQFETMEDVEMVEPRVRHTATYTQNGNLLIAGGQIQDVYVDIATATQQGGGGGFGTGTVTIQTQTIIFPSIDEVEIFNFREQEFSTLTIPDSTRASTLSSSRGRAGHATARFAGPDFRLNTGDDLFILVGGIQTSSAPQLIPVLLAPRRGETLNMKNIEVYDPTLRIFSQVGTVLLNYDRVNDPQATNLGVFNDRTPDGVLGMGNMVLVTDGDNDTGCLDTADVDELYSAIFTGFGPAQGLIFYEISGENVDGEDGHIQNQEFDTNAGMAGAEIWGRSMTNIVVLPRTLDSETRPGQKESGTWIFNGAGVGYLCAPPICPPCVNFEGTIASGALFDPMYRLIDAAAYTQDPVPDARDLKPTRNELTNPTGVVGCWLALDGKLPSHNRIGFGDVDPIIWAHNNADRTYVALVAIAGEDGIVNTTDDRVLFTGGGQNGLDFGGEASVPSSELVIIPQSP